MSDLEFKNKSRFIIPTKVPVINKEENMILSRSSLMKTFENFILYLKKRSIHVNPTKLKKTIKCV